MQQHLMQMQPMMGGSYYHNNVTTDHIQQYLDENKSLILKIVESQNSGKLSECAENQSRLQRNLMYLAAIADSQPQPSAMPGQFSMQQGSSHYMQAQQMTQQQLIAARSSLVYAQQQQQQPFSLLQQQQALHTQLGMSSGGNPGLNNMLQSEAATNVGGFSDLHGVGRGGLIGGSGKQLEIGSSGGEGHSSGERGETLYLKPANDGN